MSILSDKHFHDEKAAYAFVEARVWPEGPVCPHCGGVERISRMGGKSTRLGTFKCYQCRKPFTVKIGTIFEASHVPLRLWLQAIFLMASSKKGISSNQLARTLGITLKSAWFLSHRIREAMKANGTEPLGGAGKIVEADETFIGRKQDMERKHGVGHKMKIMSLIERGGTLRSVVLKELTRKDVQRVVRKNVARESHLMTDMAPYYRRSLGMAEHSKVDHSSYEYVRGDAHVNTLEGYFSIFKRGMKGVYQHCQEKHLHRYVAEFDFRYNARQAVGINDEMRAEQAIKGVVGKRLTYRAVT